MPSLSHPHVCSPVMQQRRELVLLEYMNFIVVGSGLLSLPFAHHRAVRMPGGTVLSTVW